MTKQMNAEHRYPADKESSLCRHILDFYPKKQKKEDFHHVIRFSVQEENFMISICALALPQMHVHVGKRDDGSVQAQV